MDAKNLLEQTIDLKASDLHLVAGVPPMVRLDGDLKSIADNAILTPDIINEGLKQILTKDQLERFSVNKEIDFSLSFNESNTR